MRQHFARWVHESANSAVRRTNQKSALLDGTKLGERQVLPRFQAVPKPGVVGHINDEFRVPMPEHFVNESWNQIFITDIRGHLMGADWQRVQRSPLGKMTGIR